MKSVKPGLAAYTAKYKGLASDPPKMVIQSPVCWALVWPPLDHENNLKITPTQFQRVQTLRAGLGTGATSTRVKSKNQSALKPVRTEGQ